MIKTFTLKNIAEGGDSSIFKIDSNLYWCSKVKSIEKIDVPVFGIKVSFVSGGHATIDFSNQTEKERDEHYFEYKRIVTF